MSASGMTRRRLLGVAGSGTLSVALATPRSGLAAPTEGELAYTNFAVAAEYLMRDFYAKALDGRLFSGAVRNALDRAAFNEREHITGFATLLSGAGQTVPQPEDFQFTWPERTFDSPAAAAKAGLAIESAVLGAYLTAATGLSLVSYRTLFVSVLASEAEHVAVLAWLAQGRPVGNSFPLAFDLETAATALELYLG